MTSEILYYVVQNNIGLKKMFKIVLGIQGRGKRLQGHVPKNYCFNGEFGIIGKFPLIIWFGDPYGTCRF